MDSLVKIAALATAGRGTAARSSASLTVLTAALTAALGMSLSPRQLAAQIIAGPDIVKGGDIVKGPDIVKSGDVAKAVIAGPAIVQASDIVEGGDVVEVEGCSIRHEKGKFTITTPGELFDLWPVKGKVNAPLVLEEMAGDFTVEVQVAHVDKAEEGTAVAGAGTVAFHAGTLVIWQDERNFVRFDRTDMNRAGRAITSSYLHVFQDGERVVELSTAIEDRPTHLRLSRRGASLTAATSQDGGQTWQSYPPQKIELPDNVRAGIAALNNTTRACTVQFADLTSRAPSEP